MHQKEHHPGNSGVGGQHPPWADALQKWLGRTRVMVWYTKIMLMRRFAIDLSLTLFSTCPTMLVLAALLIDQQQHHRNDIPIIYDDL